MHFVGFQHFATVGENDGRKSVIEIVVEKRNRLNIIRVRHNLQRMRKVGKLYLKCHRNAVERRENTLISCFHRSRNENYLLSLATPQHRRWKMCKSRIF